MVTKQTNKVLFGKTNKLNWDKRKISVAFPKKRFCLLSVIVVLVHNNMGAPFMELERPLEDVAMLCRGCLAAAGEMKDMFEWDLAEDFSKFTDVKIEQSDALSQLICINCEEMLIQCKKFKLQCSQSDLLLKNMDKKTVTPPDLVVSEPEVEIVTSCVMYDDRLVVMIIAADSQSKIYLPCPYNCAEKFIKKRDLFTHLVKTHQVDEEKFQIDLQYHCSHKTCSYNPISSEKKWFSGRKFLNQHYRKVHKSKTFPCFLCSQKFATGSDFNRHIKTCNMTYTCEICDVKYNTNEKLMVHLMRKHPDLHKQYKNEKKANKRKAKHDMETKKVRIETEKFSDYICDSPKRTSATQTLNLEENIKNDVSLVSWNSNPGKNEYNEAKTDEISTQTVFEDLLSIKSQTSEDDSIFFSETVSLSDIQTQTFPLEFGLSRSNKETITSETQSPDLSIKETQTCFCLYESPKPHYRLFDSISSSPCSINLTSTETQTGETRTNIKSDVLLSFNSAETQTSFNEDMKDI